MGKRGPSKQGSKQPNSSSGSGVRRPVKLSLREELTGKKHQNVNPKSMLKLDHLKSLATWASTQIPAPPLAAFFGQRLAASAEALGVPPDPSLFSCQRCESILQPGSNCTVRIEKNKSKVRRRKRSSVSSQNNVSYKCLVCSHKNLIRGTPRGYKKEIRPQKVESLSKPDPPRATVQKPIEQAKITTSSDGESQMDIITLPDAARDDTNANTPATPSVTPGITFLDSKRRKRNRSGAKRATEPESISALTDVEQEASVSSKRRRKGWTSLKQIAESAEKGNNGDSGNLIIPFFI